MASTATNPAKLVVGIAGVSGLLACMLLLWHFAFAEPTPVAVGTATFVTQLPIQPVTPVPVTPQPPTTPVTQPANPVAPSATPLAQLPPAAVMTQPTFLTPERRQLNLLKGGTFEDGSGGQWGRSSHRQNNSAGAIESGVVKEGQKALVLRNPIADDAYFLQAVAVKPNTRYLLSGWVKTTEVVVEEANGKTGANLSLGSSWEQTRQLVGTNDWSYVTLVFDSASRTQVIACVRLGFHQSVAKGEAWFDDLCLIPLGPSPVRPGAPSPSPSPSPPPAPGPAPKDNLLVNGSFEEGPEIPADIGWLSNVRVGSTAIKGWTVTRGSIDYVGNRLWIAGHGTHSIDLHGGPGLGGIKQSFKTVVGQRYQVSLLMAGTPQRGIPLFKLAVRAADKQQDFSFDATGKTLNQMGWTRKTWDFVAISTETTLEIHTLQTTAPEFGPVIDDVSVIALGVNAPGQPLKAEEEPTKSAANWKGWSKDTPAPAIAPFNADQAKQHQEAWAKHLGVPVEYTNSIGMKFRLVPPGEFDMGSTANEVAKFAAEIKIRNIPDWYVEKIPTEAPKHRVRITNAFYLAVNEVTQAEYERLMGNNPSQFKGDPNCPVEMVNWFEASACYRKLRDLPEEKRVQVEYRLPSEAEWEYACRAGTTTVWYSTDDETGLKDQAWFLANAGVTTHPVRQKTPNAWGLYDLHGNVWEHCEDWFGDRYYATSPVNDPLGPSAEGTRRARVARGGGDDLGGSFTCRAAARISNEPLRRVSSLGFRLALSIKSNNAAAAAIANPVQAEAPLVEISGKELCRLEGHQGPVWKAVFSADGQRVLSGSGFPNGDSTMRLWDVETGREIRQFRNDGKNWVFGVAISRDGKQVLSGNSVGLSLWEVETGAVIRQMDFDSTNKTVLTVAFSPNGKRAVSGGSDRVVRLWDLASGTQIRQLTGHLGRVMSVVFSPDGSQIVSCGLDEDKTVRLWNTETGKEVLRFEGHTAGVESVAFTPDGSRIVSSAFDGLIVWDVKAGKLIRRIVGDGTDLLEAVFFPDGRRVLSGSKSGRVSIWDSETGQELQRLAEGSEWVWTVAVAPDGLHGVSAGGSSNINGKWVDGEDFAIRLWSLPARINSVKVSDAVPRTEDDKVRKNAAQE